MKSQQRSNPASTRPDNAFLTPISKLKSVYSALLGPMRSQSVKTGRDVVAMHCAGVFCGTFNPNTASERKRLGSVTQQRPPWRGPAGCRRSVCLSLTRTVTKTSDCARRLPAADRLGTSCWNWRRADTRVPCRGRAPSSVQTLPICGCRGESSCNKNVEIQLFMGWKYLVFPSYSRNVLFDLYLF